MSQTPQTYRAYWDAGYTWHEYLDGEVEANADLWKGVYRRSRVPDWALEEVISYEGDLRLLAITEDWCGDAVNSLPAVARLAEIAPNLDLRLVKRDENPELMDRYLTGSSRSIPIVIVLDEDFSPLGAWGPRPVDLQEFVLGQKKAGERSLDEIYLDTRRWYVVDRGESTLRELLRLMAAPEACPASS